MRISDLSSDVCSSDLTVRIDRAQVADDMSFLLAACAADDTEKALRWLPGEGAALLADLGGIDEVWDDWLAAERARRHEGIVREVLAMADRLFDAGAIDQTLAVAARMTRFVPCSEHAARVRKSLGEGKRGEGR